MIVSANKNVMGSDMMERGGLQWAKGVCNLLNGGCGRKEHEYDTLISGNAKPQPTCV